MQQEKIIRSIIKKERKFQTRFLLVGELETSKFRNGECISVAMDYDKVFFRLSNFECVLVGSGTIFVNGRHTILTAKTHNKIAEQMIGRIINFNIKYKRELEDFCAKNDRKLNSLELTTEEIQQIQQEYMQNLKVRKKSSHENLL